MKRLRTSHFLECSLRYSSQAVCAPVKPEILHCAGMFLENVSTQSSVLVDSEVVHLTALQTRMDQYHPVVAEPNLSTIEQLVQVGGEQQSIIWIPALCSAIALAPSMNVGCDEGLSQLATRHRAAFPSLNKPLPEIALPYTDLH